MQPSRLSRFFSELGKYTESVGDVPIKSVPHFFQILWHECCHLIFVAATVLLGIVFLLLLVVCFPLILLLPWDAISRVWDQLVRHLYPRCPRCKLRQLKKYSFLSCPANIFHYYGCLHCQARWKRRRSRGEAPWILLASEAYSPTELQSLITRKASLMRRKPSGQNGGNNDLVDFVSDENPLASWIGKVTVALPGEEWPEYEGVPMLPLCQLQCTQIPTLPAALEPFALLCVFTAFTGNEAELRDERRCVVRTYDRHEQSTLVPLAYPGDISRIHSYPITWEVVDDGPGGLPNIPEALWIDFMGRHFLDTNTEKPLSYIGYALSKVGGYNSYSNQKDTATELGTEFLFQIHLDKNSPWEAGPAGLLCFSLPRDIGTDTWTSDSLSVGWRPDPTEEDIAFTKR